MLEEVVSVEDFGYYRSALYLFPCEPNFSRHTLLCLSDELRIKLIEGSTQSQKFA
jgi:hypothetical protein